MRISHRLHSVSRPSDMGMTWGQAWSEGTGTRGAAGREPGRVDNPGRPERVVHTASSTGSPRLRLDPLGQILHLLVGGAADGHLALDLLDPVKSRGMVPLEELSDLDQGQPGELPQEVHGDVPGR